MENSVEPAIEVLKQAGVAWVTLNRPAAINAINDAIRYGLPATLRELDQDSTVNVILLRGAGPRGFCTGADLKEVRAPMTPFQVRDPQSSANWINSFDRVAKPLIAAIHGFCMGGGMEIALACDIRIATVDAVFALPETGLGLIPGGGGTQRLPRIVGPGRAIDLLLTGDRIDGNEAYRIGLISRVVPDVDALTVEAGALARRIAQRPPLSTRLCKEAARSGIELELGAGLRLEKDLFTFLLDTEERREAAAAFRDKRPPVFKQK